MINESKKKKLKDIAEVTIALAIIGIPAFAVGALVGSCAKRKNNDKCEKSEIQNELLDVLTQDIDQNSIKVFEEGKHYISVRIPDTVINKSPCDNITGYAINNIPEGYDVYEIFSYEKEGNTKGYDIWFINTEPVEVHATYNELYNNYGYYTFGEVIEEEKVLEK